MSTMTEENPEYPTKVREFLEKHNLRKLPYGFIVAHGHMVATKTTIDVRERGYLGETAIAILEAAGISEARLIELDAQADTGTVKITPDEAAGLAGLVSQLVVVESNEDDSSVPVEAVAG